MPLNIDMTRQLRSSPQLRSLVRAVLDAHDADEQHYVEWKGNLDLKTKEAHFSIAKCILAMSNRPVELAKAYFNGCGYMIIGAEPGRMHNLELPDMANLEPWVQRYTGPEGPTWTGHTVRIDDSTALVITVEPPSDGDRLHPLVKESGSHHAGTVFVRHQARSAPMNVADLRALEHRLLAGSVGPASIGGIEVEANLPDAVQVIEVDAELLDEIIDKEREALKAVRKGSTGGTGILSTRNRIDGRTESDYRNARTQYLFDLRKALPNHVIHSALERRQDQLRLRVTNTTSQPMNDVMIRLQVEGDVRVFEEALDVDGDLPDRPKSPSPGDAFTNIPLMHHDSLLRASHFGLMQKGVEVAQDRTEIIFRIGSLHAAQSTTTPTFVLLACVNQTALEEERYAPRNVTVQISSGERSGVQETKLILDTTGITWTLSELIDSDIG